MALPEMLKVSKPLMGWLNPGFPLPCVMGCSGDTSYSGMNEVLESRLSKWYMNPLLVRRNRV